MASCAGEAEPQIKHHVRRLSLALGGLDGGCGLRRRRGPLVLVASLVAHAGLLAAWMTTRPDLAMVEPPAMVVELVHPPPREPERQPAKPVHRPPVRLRPATVAPPSDVPPLPAAAPPAEPPSPHALTDEELLAGAKPTAQQLRADRDRTAAFHGWPRGCKPASEHSNRPGPPCPAGGPDEMASRTLAERDLKTNLPMEARRKDLLKDYKAGPGLGGAYPGIRCTIFHKC